MFGVIVSDRERLLLPSDVLRFARTPVGWALLRERSQLKYRRFQFETMQEHAGLIQEAFHESLSTEEDVDPWIGFGKLWVAHLHAETDLVERQHRHLAGEQVVFNKTLASSP